MDACVHSLVTSATWKLKTLLRGQRYFTGVCMINFYKTQVLSYLEYRTAALYHATTTTLTPLDNLQNGFVRDTVGATDLEALFVFNLAPLRTRRDIAMLGIVHRAALRKGPPHLWRFFTHTPPLTHNYPTRRTRQTAGTNATLTPYYTLLAA